MRHAGEMRRLAAGLVVSISIISAACGSTPTEVEAGAPDTATAGAEPTSPGLEPEEPQPAEVPLTGTIGDLADRPPPPDGGIPVPDRGSAHTAEEYCAGIGDHRIEMAFAATVRTVDLSSVRPWVTFDVTAWYTNEVEIVMGLWAPEFSGEPGEEWLIASSRYRNITGDVFWCESTSATPEAIAEWDERYGGSVAPDLRVPEREPSPEVLALIDAAETSWLAAGIENYSADISFFDADTYQHDRCGAGGIRVTVENGKVAQARDIRRDCTVPSAEALTISDLFTVAREFAALAGDPEDGHVSVNPDYGYLEYFGGSDRSLEISIGVQSFTPDGQPLDLRDPAVALADARERWRTAAIGDYTLTVDVRCFCGLETPYTVVVRGGESPADAEGSIQSRPPVTVDELFDVLEAHVSGGADRVHLVFDRDLGHPVEARIDVDLDGDDDEVDYFVLDLTVD